MKYILIAMMVALASACTLNQPIKIHEIAKGTTEASHEVDVAQAELGEYSRNKVAIKDLDDLQYDIAKALSGQVELLQITSLHSRSKAIYAKLKSEVVSRTDELTTAQIDKLEFLDYQLISLSLEITEFVNDADNVELIDAGGKLLSLTSKLLSVYKIYKGI